MAPVQISLADGKGLDFETAPQHVLTVRTTDGGGLFDDETVTIDVADVNEAPSLTLTPTITTIDENSDTTARIEVATLAVDDDALGTEMLTLAGADAGLFEIDGGKLYLKAGVALNFEAQGSYQVSVDVDDAALGSGAEDSESYTLTVNDVNEAPTLSGSLGASVAENGSVAIDTTILAAADVDAADADADLVFTVTGANGGSVQVSGETVTSFTQADLVANVVSFQQDGSEGASASFTVSLSDGELAGGSATVAVAVSPVNDAGATGSLTLDDTPKVGVEIEAVVSDLADPDGLGATTYQWRSSVDGTNWTDIAGADQTAFTPGADEAGKYLQLVATIVDAQGFSSEILAGSLQPTEAADGVTTVVARGGETGNVGIDVSGSTGAWTIETGSGDDTVKTGSGDDRVKTNEGDDFVQTNGGDDTIVGGAGAGDDVFDAGLGGDTVDYSSATNGVVVDLAAIDRSDEPASGGGTIGDLLDGAGYDPDTAVGKAEGDDIGTDALIGVENVIGGQGDDTITGDGAGNILSGGSGDDAMNGGSGDDTLLAGQSNDTIDGGEGFDTIDMQEAGAGGAFVDLNAGLAFSTATGVDELVSIENVSGSSGSDGLYGDENDNVFEATAGSDVVDGRGDGADSDTFDASTAEDSVTINLSTGAVSGDFTATLSDIENATGGDGDDAFTGSSQANTLIGNDGADSFDGLGDGDVVDGGADIDSATFDGVFGEGGFSVAPGDAGAIVVTGPGGGETSLTGVERLTFDGGDQTVLIVGDGGYETIQDAVDAATGPNTTILVSGANSPYVEQVEIDGKTGLTIKPLGDGPVTIQAPADVIETGVSSSGRETHAIVTVENSTDVVLEGITVDGDGRGNTVDQRDGAPEAQYVGVFYRNALGGLEDVDVTGVRDPYDNGNVNGVQRGVGVQVDNDAPAGMDPLLAFFMNGGSIVDFQKNATVFNRADLEITGVTMTGGGAEPIMAQNGIQVLNSTGVISGNTITDIGYAGPAFNYSGLILAYGNTDLDITGNTLTGTNGVDFGSKVIGVYILDFGDPAFVNSGGSVTGNFISFVDEGIDVTGAFTGEGVTIGGNTITDVDPNDPFSTGVYFDPDDDVTVGFAVEGSATNDFLDGAVGTDSLEGLDGDDAIAGQGGNDTLEGGGGDDAIDGGTGVDSLVGGGGEDDLDGGAGADVMAGGADDDAYTVDDAGDTIVEAEDGGEDTVESSVDHTLAENVENLVLTDVGSDTQDFEDFDLGAIANGENGWTVHQAGLDQGVVDLGGNKAFRMSSDPASGAFGGPYSPDFGVSAGEPGTTADGEVHVLKFTLKSVSDIADGSRIEVDFGTQAGTDRNNFMIIENYAGGLRIAAVAPAADGSFPASGGAAPNDYLMQTVASGLDPAESHDIELRLTYEDGPNNDVIEIYVDGALVGLTSTFENFRNAHPASPGHEANAEVNQTNRIFFRPSANGAAQDGPGGQNQGFYFDDISNTITNHTNGTGNASANAITGNSGDNQLSGLDGDDTLTGGAGADTLFGNDDDDRLVGGEGSDLVFGAFGDDTAVLDVSSDGSDQINLGAGDDVVEVSGASQVRLTFTSSEVGNGAASDSNTMLNQDGNLAVRVQAEDGGALTGPVSRTDDEGITFVAAPGTTFDVRDLVSGAARGDQFDVVTLGTSNADTIAPGIVGSALNYYVNGGQGNDTITGEDGDDFLVGGAGDDSLTGGLGQDSFIGGGGADAISGGGGGDVATLNVTSDGADAIDLGAGADQVNVNAMTAGQVRLTFTSADVGDGAALDGGAGPNEDGGLAVRVQAENGSDGLTGPTSRVDDEGVTFVAGDGVTFDVRDLGGAARGDQFTTATLGTEAAESLTGTNGADYINAGQGADDVSGGAGNDFLVGGAGADQLNGGGDNDSFIGGGGNDAFNGDSGVDGAIFAKALGSYTITESGGAFTITDTATSEADTLTNVERVEFSDQDVWLVTDSAGLTTALANAGDDDVIKLADNTYSGSFNVTSEVTIESLSGNADGVILEGTFKSANGLDPEDSVATFLETATGYSGGANPTGLTIGADNVTIQNITLSSYLTGVNVGSNSGLTLDGVNIDGTVFGVNKSTQAIVTDFEWTGGTVSDGYIGASIQAAINDLGDFSNVLIQGVTFENLNEKGLYFEQLSDAQLLDLVMTNVGEFGRGPAFGGTLANGNLGGFGAGIDINLKYEDYSDITISGFDFTNVGSSTGHPSGNPHPIGGAITIKARDDSASGYGAPNQATLDGVIITDGTIDGTSTGIRIGEPGRNNFGPTNVVVTDVGVSGALVAEFDNRSQSTLTVTLTAGDDVITTNPNATGPIKYLAGDGDDDVTGGGGADTIEGGIGGDSLAGAGGNDSILGGSGSDQILGGSGDDMLKGGAGSDIIQGGANTAVGDTAVYDGDFSQYTITRSGGTYTVTRDGDTDIVTGVENFNFGGTVVSVVGDPDVIVNDGPTILSIDETVNDEDGRPDTFGAEENSPTGTVVATVTASDPNLAAGDVLRFELVDANGDPYDGPYTITKDSPTTATITVSGPLNFEGDAPPAFVVRVTDGSGEVDEQSVTVTVVDVNEAPTNLALDSDPVFENDDGPVIVGELTVTGPSSDLTFTVSDPRFEVQENGGVLQLVLADGESLDFEVDGPQLTVTITATHDDGEFYSEPFVIDVEDVNEAPTAIELDNASVDENAEGAVVGAVTVADPDAGDSFEFEVSDIRFEVVDGVLKLKDGVALDFESGETFPISVTITATDDEDGDLTVSETFQITVNNLDEAPGGQTALVVDLEQGATEAPLLITPLSDPDGPLTYTVGALPTSGVAYRVNNGALEPLTVGMTLTVAQLEGLVYTATDDDDGPLTLVIDATDPQNNATPITVTLNITDAVADTYPGTADADRLDGAALNDVVNGLGGQDTLLGGSGNDTLNGGAGADTMIGGTGNDLIYVNTAADVVVEASGLSGGSDIVATNVSYTLADGVGVEDLRTTNVNGTAAIDLTGNGVANRLTGNDAANTLDGKGGADTMRGEGGDDTFFVDNAGDVVIEARASDGSDTVAVRVSYELTAGSHVETLRTTNNNGTAAIDLTGNEFANRLNGNAGANELDGAGGGDALYGLGGGDRLIGGDGSDSLFGGAGADVFVFDQPLGTFDRINDFETADTIELSQAIFGAAGGPGTLSPGAFNTGAAASDASDRIVYNETNGRLIYDADGAGGSAGVLFAVLKPDLALTSDDFTIV